MAQSLSSILVGSAISLLAGASLLLNICVLFVFWRGGFMKSSQSHIYIFAFANVFGNAFQMALSTFYLGPSSIAQDFLLPGGKDGFGVKFMSYLFLGQWYQEMFIQIIIAVDRMVTVVFPKYAFIFSRKVVTVLAVGVFVGGFVLAFISDYVISCCTAYIYYGVYAYTYLDKGNNYVNGYIDLPLNAISSGIALTCYLIIYLYILHANRKVAGQIQPTMAQQRRKKEVRYALQFAAISFFVLFAWVSFRVFPLAIPPNRLEFFSLIAFALIFHCSSSAVIFVTLNKEFRRQFYLRLCSFNTVTLYTSRNSRNSRTGQQLQVPPKY